MVHENEREIYTDAEGMALRLKTTGEVLGSRLIKLPGMTADDFEEASLADIAAEREAAEAEADRSRRISALIHERYSLDDEVAIIRQKDDSDAKRAEYEEYCRFAELCKRQTIEMNLNADQ